MAIAPQFEKLMAGCQELTFSHLRPLMDRMFENADVALLDFAEKAKVTWPRRCFSKPWVKPEKRSAIEQQFYTEIKTRLFRFSLQTRRPTPACER